MLFSLGPSLIDMLNCVSVIYLSEQKRLAAKQKEDAWEGKWLDRKLKTPHLFSCLFVCLFLDSLIQQMLKSPVFFPALLFCFFFIILATPSPTALSRNGFLPVLHQLLLNISSFTVRLLQRYIRWESPATVPSPLCSLCPCRDCYLCVMAGAQLNCIHIFL